MVSHVFPYFIASVTSLMPVTNKTPIVFNVLKQGDRNTLIYTLYSNTLKILQMPEQ